MEMTIKILQCCKFNMSYRTLSVYLDIHVVIDLCLVKKICSKGHINENPNNKNSSFFVGPPVRLSVCLSIFLETLHI